MLDLKNPKVAIPIVLIAGVFWSFGPYVVRHIDQPETVPWQYLFTRGGKRLLQKLFQGRYIWRCRRNWLRNCNDYVHMVYN